MKITFLGHAGLFLETSAGSILCDPWFNPAFFASWFPFPDNSGVDLDPIRRPDYLYISHEHHDHLDRRFLRDHVHKQAVVILPDYPVKSLERELAGLGFSSFLRTTNWRPVDVDGLRLVVVAMVSPSDGPEGDSALIVDDGEHRVFNQNDCRPADLDAVQAHGPFDAHFLQFSGAIWYPMVYRLPPRTKAALAARKRANQYDRALSFIRQMDAASVFPTAGPPCFLDDDLGHLNDIEGRSDSIFCDQSHFLDYLREQGNHRGRLVVPGSVIDLARRSCRINHPIPERQIRAIFEDKASYLAAYRDRRRPQIEAERSTWSRGRVDLLDALRDRLEPLLQIAPLTCAAINARVLLDCGEDKLVVDFRNRSVYRHGGEECRFRFWIDAALIETCLVENEPDWVNSLFLSCRFDAERDGPYNEYVYNFFKCLEPERLQYAEGCYAAHANGDEWIQMGDYLVQRRCPHLRADLARFGKLENGILTCSMHGWQFDVASGRCITADDCRLSTRRIDEKRRSG